ncbi:acyl-CoA synthetase (AMP-forming)/AMP-acid ligase II [Frankia casuarinae]|uniref:AMP-dependent synthetase and ligase n=2 Tax=Frankia casuarinae (strain DSM 45818 / CECT 9043 / HFP020203 / CcI3) TaxID=106370 RepID=Q2JAB9_FRACC|nr:MULTISPECIES: AMP-binding protein [Frankia]ABD11773.1 AMP-dependent synthetase and ligase [Frankia casuarinae]ETA03386.1 acyl-CoA synthetase (AMP-forming)/AMP-acid ligase II [Frankia sp. CcI6]EYT93164.1 acyl-CoA synthetase (AMP-forming)/AMP-acid ligase II [Frankia casuarinae]OHV56241.1 AMP-dependent synthetase [Frankia sp. CgIS1]
MRKGQVTQAVPVPPPLRPDDRFGNVVDRIRTVAMVCHDVVAVRDEHRAVTFAQLVAWVDVVADRILRQPAAADPDTPVAVLLPHGASGIAAVLGVIASGRPCVPLDRMHPTDRLAQVVGLAGASVCVTGPTGSADQRTAAALPGIVETIDVGDERVADWSPALADRVASTAPRRADTDPAVLIFTSGSTGVPKGVVWHHRALLGIHYAIQVQDVMRLVPGDRLPLFLPYSFISGMNRTVGGLVFGTTLEMYDPRVRGVRDLADWLRATRPAGIVATPALIRIVFGCLEPDEVLDDLRFVMSVGEAIYARDVELARHHLPPAAAFLVSYGASELGTATCAPIWSDDDLPDGVMPAGRPVVDVAVRVVSPDGIEMPPGETGEIVVMGHFITGGYWRAPAASASRFGIGPDGTPTYRTGDLGRIDASGQLRVVGRNDAAVKIRGYLVEPIEIESALLASSDVLEAVVVADRTTQRARLVAYVVPVTGARVSPASIRRLLRAKLPSYMVPATVMLVTALPRTDRSKVDRLNLPPAGPKPGQDPPRDQWEEAVAGVWAAALHLDDVGIHDDFVELGGDSLIAEELLTRVADELGVKLPTSTVADAPTVAEFTARLRNAGTDVLRHPTVVPLRTTGSGGPLFCFCGAGGLAVGMLGFARHFDGERPVYGVQAHGLEYRGLPDWSIYAAARRHARTLRLLQPAGPYYLAGHSFGGLVALETARLLTEAGEHVELLVLIDSFLPDTSSGVFAGGVQPSQLPVPGGPTRSSNPAPALDRARGSAMGPARAGAAARVLLGWARQAAQLPLAGVVQFKGMNQYDVFYNQSRVLTRFYRPKPWNGRALVYLAAASPPHRTEAWRPLLTGETTYRTVGGDHDTVLREPVVSEIAADIRAVLAGCTSSRKA